MASHPTQNKQVELLAKAIELEGSAQAVASALRVPEKTFERWRAGSAQMSEKAFALLIELIAQRHQKPR